MAIKNVHNLIAAVTDYSPDQPRDENGRWTDTGAASSKSLSVEERKRRQCELIQRENPKDPKINAQATWVEKPEDILTWEECMYESDYAEDDVTPDFTWEDAKKAAERGWVMVYSSKPIKQGSFVTPSKMIAQSYGNDRPYTMKVNLEDVAWIDTSEGQLAKL